jgi:hypothetical protein
MKFQLPIDISVRCYVCGEKLSAVLFDPEGYDLVLSVEPCKKCGLTQLAPDGAYFCGKCGRMSRTTKCENCGHVYTRPAGKA